jgi:predicted dehydrogenase
MNCGEMRMPQGVIKGPGGQAMVNRFKVAVIGTGDMGSRHIEGWTLAGHDVVALADVDLARARELADQHGVPNVYADYRELLADPDIAIVSVCTPLALHAPITIAAAEHDKHVFQRNLATWVDLLACRAREGHFGQPLVFHSEALAEVRPKRVMHDRRGNNGPIMDTGCHFFLLWQTVFGSRPQAAYAQGRILAKERPEIAHFKELAIDTAVITLTYESGDIATLTVSWGLAAHTQLQPRPDRVFGPLGGAERSPQGLTLYQGDQIEALPLAPENLHQKELALFAEAVATGQPPVYGFQAGKEMLATTLAIFQSIETGTVVPISYDF